MEQKRKASEEPIEVWDEKLFKKLRKLGFREIFFTRSKKTMNRDAQSGTMPAEYKKRPLKQGMQRRFELPVGNRIVGILTSFSPKINGKKEGYLVWIYITGQSVMTKNNRFISSPVYDTPSLFDIAMEWVHAYIDVATHWPVYAKPGKAAIEYQLKHIPGILNMVQFEHVERNGAQVKKTSFLLTEAKFSEETMKFFNKRYIPDYKKQLKAKEENKELPKSRRVTRAEKREEALHPKQK